jgi:hypothetical protein
MKQSPHEHFSSASLSPEEESADSPSPHVLAAGFAGPVHTEVPLPGRFVLVDATIPDAQLLIAQLQPLEPAQQAEADDLVGGLVSTDDSRLGLDGFNWDPTDHGGASAARRLRKLGTEPVVASFIAPEAAAESLPLPHSVAASAGSVEASAASEAAPIVPANASAGVLPTEKRTTPAAAPAYLVDFEPTPLPSLRPFDLDLLPPHKQSDSNPQLIAGLGAAPPPLSEPPLAVAAASESKTDRPDASVASAVALEVASPGSTIPSSAAVAPDAAGVGSLSGSGLDQATSISGLAVPNAPRESSSPSLAALPPRPSTPPGSQAAALQSRLAALRQPLQTSKSAMSAAAAVAVIPTASAEPVLPPFISERGTRLRRIAATWLTAILLGGLLLALILVLRSCAAEQLPPAAKAGQWQYSFLPISKQRTARLRLAFARAQVAAPEERNRNGARAC